jgi:hypothetical protein
MGEGLAAEQPRGLFKRDAKGLATAPVTVQVERGRILMFGRLLGETDPLFTDVAAARANGHPDIAAPPSFATVIEMLAHDDRRRAGAPDLMRAIGCDFRHLLHGEQRYAYEGLIYGGDEVSVSTEVVDFYDKRGGLLEFAVLETSIVQPERGARLLSTQTLVHRLG